MNEAMYKKIIKAARKRDRERVNERIQRIKSYCKGDGALFDSMEGLNMEERLTFMGAERPQAARSFELNLPVL